MFLFEIHSELSFKKVFFSSKIPKFLHVFTQKGNLRLRTFLDVIIRKTCHGFFHVMRSARNTTSGNGAGNWYEKLPNNFIYFLRPNG